MPKVGVSISLNSTFEQNQCQLAMVSQNCKFTGYSTESTCKKLEKTS